MKTKKEETPKVSPTQERITAFRNALSFGLAALNYWDSQTKYYQNELNKLELSQTIKQPNDRNGGEPDVVGKPKGGSPKGDVPNTVDQDKVLKK